MGAAVRAWRLAGVVAGAVVVLDQATKQIVVASVERGSRTNIFLTFVRDVVDPYLNLFRRLLPMARIGPAAIDLSPMIGTIVLLVVGQLVANLIDHG